MSDCEFLEDGAEFAKEFVDKFIEEFNYIRKEKLSGAKHAKHHQYHEDMNIELQAMKPNVKFMHLKKLQDIPENLLEKMNLKELNKKCNELHEQIRKIKREQKEDKEEEFEIEQNDSENIKR